MTHYLSENNFFPKESNRYINKAIHATIKTSIAYFHENLQINHVCFDFFQGTNYRTTTTTNDLISKNPSTSMYVIKIAKR